MRVIFDMLISLLERAEWCHRDDFHGALPLLLRGEDPEFQQYIRRIAHERGAPLPIP